MQPARIAIARSRPRKLFEVRRDAAAAAVRRAGGQSSVDPKSLSKCLADIGERLVDQIQGDGNDNSSNDSLRQPT